MNYNASAEKMQERFSNFNPDADIPRGKEFAEQPIEAFPQIPPSAAEFIARTARWPVLSVAEQSTKMEQLKQNPSAGDILFQLAVAADRLIVWLAKDFALYTTELIGVTTNTELASLIFMELLGRASQEFSIRVLHADVDPSEFAREAVSILAQQSNAFLDLKLPVSKLQLLMRYRSVKNAIMQSTELKPSDVELSEAIGVSTDELREIEEMNERVFGSHDGQTE